MVTKVTNYFHASVFFDIAKRAAEGENTDPDAPIIAVMFSVLALEAFINEAGALARTVGFSESEQHVEEFYSIMKELEERRESLLAKYDKGLLVFTDSMCEKGAQPFQDFKLLVTIRNSAVHMKADEWRVKVEQGKTDPERGITQYPKFVKTLQQRKIIELSTDSNSWLDEIMQPHLSTWACKTAEAITKYFLDVVPAGYYKESLSRHVFSIK